MVITKSKHSYYHQIEGLLPNTVLLMYYYLLYNYSDALWTHPALSLIAIGPFFTGSCARLIVSTVSKARFSLFDEFHLSLPTVLSLVIFPANKIYGLGINELYIYGVLIFLNTFMYFLYVMNAIDQIKTYLGIYCLTIKLSDKKEK
jgi:hypothetical protein